MSAQVIAFPKAAESEGAPLPIHSAQVVEFPPELREQPLRTLAAEWLYFTDRARYYRATERKGPLPGRACRALANEYGDRAKVAPRVAKRYAREIAEAAAYLREHAEDRYTGQGWRDEWMLTWIAISFDTHGREVSPGLRLIERAANARRMRAGLRAIHHPRNSPGAA